jgi:predicted hydrolase (HD superfamily)
MLVTGNGVVWSVEEENDLWIMDLLAAIDSIPDTIEDEVADHALDTICFLQDEDVCTPMDAVVQAPWMATLTDLDLE